MHIDLFPLLYLWLALDVVIIGLFGWRQKLARHEEGSVKLVHGASGQQAALAGKLDQVDKWGKMLTIAAVVFGVLLGALAIYQSLNSTGTPGV